MGGVKLLRGNKGSETESIEGCAEINDCCIRDLADHAKITKCLTMLRMSYGNFL
jgi:hypothetical protein